MCLTKCMRDIDDPDNDWNFFCITNFGNLPTAGGDGVGNHYVWLNPLNEPKKHQWVNDCGKKATEYPWQEFWRCSYQNMRTSMCSGFNCGYRLPSCSGFAFVEVEEVNFVAIERKQLWEIVHLENNFVEPTDFMNEENFHSLRVFVPSFTIDVSGVTLDEFGNSPRNV